MQGIHRPPLFILLLFATGCSIPGQRPAGAGPAGHEHPGPTRQPPPRIVADSLVQAPHPTTMREGDVRLFRGDRAVMVGRKFTSRVAEVSDGKIRFDDGHILFFGLPEGHRVPFSPGALVEVDFTYALKFFSYFRSVRIRMKNNGALRLQITGDGDERPVEAELAGQTLRQGGAQEAQPMVKGGNVHQVPPELVVGFQAQPLPVDSAVSVTIGSDQYLITVQESIHVEPDTVLQEGAPYRLYFTALRQ